MDFKNSGMKHSKNNSLMVTILRLLNVINRVFSILVLDLAKLDELD